MAVSQAQDIRTFIQKNAHPDRRPPANYTGSPHTHHGVRVPAMRSFLKTWARSNHLGYEAWQATLDDLYRGDSLEEKLFAGMLLAHHSEFRRQLPLATLDNWLGQLQGWNEIDMTCQSGYTAADLLADWRAWDDFLRRLASDENINKRRASLVLLIRPLRESADERLLATAFTNIEALKRERDTLITKAVSWVLRAGLKQHHTVIDAYLTTNAGTLPAVAVREVRKKLDTGIK